MIVLVGGEGYPFRAERLKNMPIMILNGELDLASYPFLPEVMVNALKRVGNEPVYINYPDRGHSLVGKYEPEKLKEWLLEHIVAVEPGNDPIEDWDMNENGISTADLIEIPGTKVYGLTDRENPAYPQDNPYRSSMKIYQAYREAKSTESDWMADGLVFIQNTGAENSRSSRILLDAPMLENLAFDGDLTIVDLEPMKAMRFYVVTENSWDDLCGKMDLIRSGLVQQGISLSGEERIGILSIMDHKRRYWEVKVGID
jgi:hypothetical protein